MDRHHNIEWNENSNRVRKYNITSNRQQLNHCQKSDRHCHKMWLQKQRPNTQKVMMVEKSSSLKNQRVTLDDSYKKKTRRKNNEDFSERKRDWESEKKSYWTLRLRESLTSTPAPREENQRTACTATCYLHKYSVVPTAQGDSLLIVHVIHDLINEHNGGHMHHSLGRTTLKKRD